ncbi:MAG: hypothetical protein H6740_07075 [Alphaproteobacteria bacterium]|nr:hypothetical protein [Alphaproteobacteria bacterium]
MYAFVELEVLEGAPAFDRPEARRGFLERAARGAGEGGVQLLAYALTRDRAGLVVLGPEVGLSRWVGHLRTAHALWRRYAGRPLGWGEPAIIPLPGPELALDYAMGLHRLGRPDPLADPGSSLWDALGLRESVVFDPAWLRARAAPQRWLEGAGLGLLRPPRLALSGPVPFAAWWQVEAAVRAATGAEPDARPQRVLRVQLAWRAGWTPEALGAITGVGPAAIRRALRCPPRPTLPAALAWLREPELRARLPRGPVRAHLSPERPCPAPSSSSIRLVG